jgi:GT2 family glycosyltransferase
MRAVDAKRAVSLPSPISPPSPGSPHSPKVSICVPVYNCADTIERTIDSALAQTFTDFECLVVDNDSTDSTVERILSYDDARIRLVRNEANLGGVGNHNKCLSLARGELVQFLHGDDWLLPHCLESLVPTFESANVGLAFAPRRVDTADASWKERYARLEGPLRPLRPTNEGFELVRRYLAAGGQGNPIGEPTSVMVRHATLLAVGGFRPQIPGMSDIDAWLRLLCRADAAFVEDELTVRWHHAGSETDAQKGTHTLDQMWVLADLVRSRGIGTALRMQAFRLWLSAAARLPKTLCHRPRGQRGQHAMNFASQARYLATGSMPELQVGQ